MTLKQNIKSYIKFQNFDDNTSRKQIKTLSLYNNTKFFCKQFYRIKRLVLTLYIFLNKARQTTLLTLN